GDPKALSNGFHWFTLLFHAILRAVFYQEMTVSAVLQAACTPSCRHAASAAFSDIKRKVVSFPPTTVSSPSIPSRAAWSTTVKSRLHSCTSVTAPASVAGELKSGRTPDHE